MNLRIEQRKLTDAHKESGQKFPDLVTQRLQERVNKMQKLHITRIKLPTDIFIVSCAETLSGIIIYKITFFLPLQYIHFVVLLENIL